MSGVGKSTVVARLAQLGYRAIDTDEGGLSVDVHSPAGRERLWREDRIQELLSDESSGTPIHAWQNASKCRSRMPSARIVRHQPGWRSTSPKCALATLSIT